jgi:hypothetical protein
MSAVEKFITDLNDLVTSVKEQKQENEELKAKMLDVTSLNEQLREYGKRIHELESGLCQIHDSSDLEKIKEITNSLIKDEIAKRNLVNSDVHEFFYKRVEELGIRPDFLRDKLKDSNTFVVGRIVLESVLCQRLESSLPITLYTCDDNVIAGFDSDYQCPQVTTKRCYNFSHQGVKYFRIYRLKDVDEMIESVDNDLTFCQNYFDGKNFIVRDTESVVKKRHIAHSGIRQGGMLDVFKPYYQLGFTFRFPKASKDRKARKMTIMGIGSKPITFKPVTMADFINRHIQSLGKDAETITELMGLPDTVMVGDSVQGAFLGNPFSYEHAHLICYNLPIVFTIMERRGYESPKLLDLTVGQQHYTRADFGCLNGKGTISIRISKNDDKEFTKVYTKYTAMGGLNYDGKKFTKYRISLNKERTVTKEEFDSMAIPIQ